MDKKDALFCATGGCGAKLGPALLQKILEKIPKKEDENLIIGYDKSDDAAVYKLTEEIAIVETLDFFTPIVEDPYTFGKIAAANALSDIYAMGGEVKVALNIVCFPEKMDANILGQILIGGAEKVIEAGGVLSGGHSINDDTVKYGLSVTGIVNPKKILSNNGSREGDVLILTKPLGTGIISSADRVNMASKESLNEAINSMQTLNKYAAEIMSKYNVNACTDVTGFGFLGHLNEMINDDVTAIIESDKVPCIEEAYNYAKEFLTTAAGQRNRNFLRGYVNMEDIELAVQEILYDPQTSGGLLISVPENEAKSLFEELQKLDIKSGIVGKMVKKENINIIVK